jgi:hypothetical protein
MIKQITIDVFKKMDILFKPNSVLITPTVNRRIVNSYNLKYIIYNYFELF